MTCLFEHESHGLHEFCTTLRPCGLRGGINCLTQTTQKTQKFSINANLDSNLDTFTHDAAPVRHPDGDWLLAFGFLPDGDVDR